MLRYVGVRSDIVSIFVREGTFYFIAVAAVNILNVSVHMMRHFGLF